MTNSEWATRELGGHGNGWGLYRRVDDQVYDVKCQLIVTGAPPKACRQRGLKYGQLLRVRCWCMAQLPGQLQRPERRHTLRFDFIADVPTYPEAVALWNEHKLRRIDG